MSPELVARLVEPEALMATTKNAVLMHPLPVRRNVAATDAVLDGKQSVIYEQAAKEQRAVVDAERFLRQREPVQMTEQEMFEAAIAKLGATYEGVLRRYQRRQDGTVRDTVMYAVTAEEWPGVRERLRARLAR